MSQEKASSKLTCNHFPPYQIQRQHQAPAHSATYSLPACPLSAGNPPASPALESWTWCWERSVWLCPLSKDKRTLELQKHWWLFYVSLQYVTVAVLRLLWLFFSVPGLGWRNSIVLDSSSASSVLITSTLWESKRQECQSVCLNKFRHSNYFTFSIFRKSSSSFVPSAPISLSFSSCRRSISRGNQKEHQQEEHCREIQIYGKKIIIWDRRGLNVKRQTKAPKVDDKKSGLKNCILSFAQQGATQLVPKLNLIGYKPIEK